MTFINIIKGGWNGLLDLFYPPLCCSCGSRLASNKDIICDNCLNQLPKTEMADHRDNSVENLFWDIKKFDKGGSFCYYTSNFRNIIHHFKYKNQPQIGVFLGELAGKEFDKKGFFEGIDIIVPIPLHKKRLKQRGFNQAEEIAIGLSKSTSIPMDNQHLYRTRDNETQTQKTAAERAKNTINLFAVNNPQQWRGKHILLVDDIITTGATMRAAIAAITPIRQTKISVFTLGCARQQNNSPIAYL
ncbi:MAG: ComF family protein [Paludibacteraceae bacterium]|nr:ComF family protein [Paludibacteraceae bacterium]